MYVLFVRLHKISVNVLDYNKYDLNNTILLEMYFEFIDKYVLIYNGAIQTSYIFHSIFPVITGMIIIYTVN